MFGFLAPEDPSIQIILTLGPKVYKYYLHWAIRIPRGAFGLELNAPGGGW